MTRNNRILKADIATELYLAKMRIHDLEVKCRKVSNEGAARALRFLAYGVVIGLLPMVAMVILERF